MSPIQRRRKSDGGDSDHKYSKSCDIQLKDAWKNGPRGANSIPKPNGKDVTNGQARGDTWGYQQANGGKQNGQRLDKFLHTHFLECVPLRQGSHLTRGIRRLGVDLKTTVTAYKQRAYWLPFLHRGQRVTFSKVGPSLHSFEAMKSIRSRGFPASKFVKTSTQFWVSDHYGIMAQFRLVKTSKAEIAKRAVSSKQ